MLRIFYVMECTWVFECCSLESSLLQVIFFKCILAQEQQCRAHAQAQRDQGVLSTQGWAATGTGTLGK